MAELQPSVTSQSTQNIATGSANLRAEADRQARLDTEAKRLKAQAIEAENKRKHQTWERQEKQEWDRQQAEEGYDRLREENDRILKEKRKQQLLDQLDAEQDRLNAAQASAQNHATTTAVTHIDNATKNAYKNYLTAKNQPQEESGGYTPTFGGVPGMLAGALLGTTPESEEDPSFLDQVMEGDLYQKYGSDEAWAPYTDLNRPMQIDKQTGIASSILADMDAEQTDALAELIKEFGPIKKNLYNEKGDLDDEISTFIGNIGQQLVNISTLEAETFRKIQQLFDPSGGSIDWTKVVGGLDSSTGNVRAAELSTGIPWGLGGLNLPLGMIANADQLPFYDEVVGKGESEWFNNYFQEDWANHLSSVVGNARGNSKAAVRELIGNRMTDDEFNGVWGADGSGLNTPNNYVAFGESLVGTQLDMKEKKYNAGLALHVRNAAGKSLTAKEQASLEAWQRQVGASDQNPVLNPNLYNPDTPGGLEQFAYSPRSVSSGVTILTRQIANGLRDWDEGAANALERIMPILQDFDNAESTNDDDYNRASSRIQAVLEEEGVGSSYLIIRTIAKELSGARELAGGEQGEGTIGLPKNAGQIFDKNLGLHDDELHTATGVYHDVLDKVSNLGMTFLNLTNKNNTQANSDILSKGLEKSLQELDIYSGETRTVTIGEGAEAVEYEVPELDTDFVDKFTGWVEKNLGDKYGPEYTDKISESVIRSAMGGNFGPGMSPIEKEYSQYQDVFDQMLEFDFK